MNPIDPQAHIPSKESILFLENGFRFAASKSRQDARLI